MDNHQGYVSKDGRFSRVYADPRFKKPKKKEFKVELDERFSGMLTEAAFQQEGSSYPLHLWMGECSQG